MKQFTKVLAVLSFLSVNQMVLANECQDAKNISGFICDLTDGVNSVLSKYYAGLNISRTFCIEALVTAKKACES